MKVLSLSLLAAIGLLLIASQFVKVSSEEAAKYPDSGPCQYCEYCDFCGECRHCPCESRGPDDLPYCEYCEYCKYCRFCSVCKYCEDGGILSRVTGSVMSWAETVWSKIGALKGDVKEMFNLFEKHDFDKDTKVSKEKLDEITSKYKDIKDKAKKDEL